MRKVLITGGQGDIAKAIGKRLAADGNFEVRTPGRRELDVTSIESARNYVENFTPDVLVNNAGYVFPQSLRGCDAERLQEAIAVNLFGVFNCAAAVLARNPKAQIINIGSSAATKIHGTWSSYCASKAGVVMATECWAEDGINAVCISPGRTMTKMRRGLYPGEDQSTLLNPADFAEIVYFAIQGRYPPGSHINVNLQNVGELIHAQKRS